jgi:hypothetical protein
MKFREFLIWFLFGNRTRSIVILMAILADMLLLRRWLA